MDFRNQPNLPRGIRNNNPGNIKSGEGWKGVVGSDGTFDIFSDDTWGLRALAMDINSKVHRGLISIRQVITEYAPPSENDTAKYISDVSNQSGIDPDQPLDLPDDLPGIMRAIVMHENGAPGQLVSDQDIAAGIAMMGSGVSTLLQEGESALENNTDNSTVILAIAAGVVLYLIFSKRQ